MPEPERPEAVRPDRGRPARPRQERAQVTQAAIIRAAAGVFAERGYARTTLDAVAVEAGVTKGALYFHFASKHDLANAVIREEMRVTGESVEAQIADAPSPLAAMLLLTKTFSSQLTEDVVVQAGIKLTTEELVSRLDIEEPYRAWMHVIESLARRGVDEGDLRPDLDLAAFGTFFAACFTGVQLVSDSLTGRADLFARARDMWEILLPGIVAEGRLEAARELLTLLDD